MFLVSDFQIKLLTYIKGFINLNALFAVLENSVETKHGHNLIRTFNHVGSAYFYHSRGTYCLH